MAVLKNAIVVLRVNVYLQELVVGIVVVLAVLMDQFRRGNISLRFLRRKT
jgi:ribose transport system permease protein